MKKMFHINPESDSSFFYHLPFFLMCLGRGFQWDKQGIQKLRSKSCNCLPVGKSTAPSLLQPRPAAPACPAGTRHVFLLFNYLFLRAQQDKN